LVAISRDDQERARAHLLSAECALRRGRRHRALAKLDALAQALPDTAAGEAALFETAKLQAELGKPETALATVEHYLKIHPEGRFAEAGSMRRCELLVTLGRRAAARSCLDVYRRRFPNAARRHHAALLLGSLARLEGSYAEAAAAFEEFLALAPGSPHAEEAAYGRAWSLREGRLQGAGAAAAEYVRRYPDGAHADEVRAWLEAAAEGAR
jgi:outer membrane protein assembly factor BamD (BamD/ComL family)